MSRGSTRLTFAVMMAAYNAEQTIHAAIESVFQQTRKVDEIIVCNDGSTDRTGEILASYGSTIRVITQANAGVSAASNVIARCASSDFLARLDSDDSWLPERIERIESYLAEQPHLDIVTTDAWVFEEGSPPGRYYEIYNIAFPPEERQEIEILRSNFIFGSAAVRRTALLAVGGWDEARSHQCEYDAWIRMILAGSRAGLVSEPLAIYNIRPDSHGADRRAAWLSVVELLQGLLAEAKLTDEQLDAVTSHSRRIARIISVIDAQEAIVKRQNGVRARCLSASAVPGHSPSLRMKLVAAAAFPGLARRMMRSRRV